VEVDDAVGYLIGLEGEGEQMIMDQIHHIRWVGKEVALSYHYYYFYHHL